MRPGSLAIASWRGFLHLDADLVDLSGGWLGECVPELGDLLPVCPAALLCLRVVLRLPEGDGVALVYLGVRQHEPAPKPPLLSRILGTTELR